ncbi:MAG: flagellar basal body L-ring protein FlgH [Vicinamibacterales bacterium]
MTGKVVRLVGIAGAALLLVAGPVSAAQAEGQKTAKPNDNYDVLFQQYLASARTTPVNGPDSLWMAGLFGDLRARRVNDLLTINVMESVSAQGSADSSLDKSSSGKAGVSSFFGVESKAPSFLNPANLATFGTDTSFKGGGTTQRSGTLQAVMTARVAEVLPNGDLGIEGVREIDINGDRQIIVVTGVVRAVDVMAGNVVPSTAIGQMRIRYFGRGLIKDNLNPGWLVRVLNKIF